MKYTQVDNLQVSQVLEDVSLARPIRVSSRFLCPVIGAQITFSPGFGLCVLFVCLFALSVIRSV